MFEEVLINEIFKHPCIYNKKDWAYKNKIKREKAWASIATEPQASASQCQGRWKTLRDRFVKEVNKSITPSGSGAPEGGTNWKYMAAMEFMRVHVTPRPTISSIQFDDDFNACYETDELQSPSFDELSQEFTSSHSFTDEQTMPSSKNSSKRKAADAAQESFEALCGTVNTIVQEQFSRVSRNEAFYKFLDTILTKVNEKAQDAIKLQLIAFCSEQVNNKLENNANLND